MRCLGLSCCSSRVGCGLADPTLAELTGLPPPQTLGQELNGTSLVPIFERPATATVKAAAFSQFAKSLAGAPKTLAEHNWGPNLPVAFSIWNKFHRNQTEIMGYTVRVEDWRYTAWFPFDKQAIRPQTDGNLGRELYDHRGDSGLWMDFPENRNLAGEPEHAAVVQELHAAILGYIRL